MHAPWFTWRGFPARWLVISSWLLFVSGCLLACGCGKGAYKLAPVSGQVTLDGKAIENLSITFQPIAPQGAATPAAISTGMTDAQGRFTLKTTGTAPKGGAVVGKHRVVMLARGEGTGTSDSDAPKPAMWILPVSCRDGSMTFEVPNGGTDKANFDLKSADARSRPGVGFQDRGS